MRTSPCGEGCGSSFEIEGSMNKPSGMWELSKWTPIEQYQ